MVRRPSSIHGARRAVNDALIELELVGQKTPCQDRPVPFTEVRQTPADAARLCGRGTDAPCPILELCAPLGYTESVYADDMVYGGYSWRRGLPVSETDYRRTRHGRKQTRLQQNQARHAEEMQRT